MTEPETKPETPEDEAAQADHSEAVQADQTPRDQAPPAPFVIGGGTLVALCLGSGMAGGVVVLTGMALFGIGVGPAMPGQQAEALHSLGIAPAPILPSANEIRHNAMTGQAMRGPWPAAEFRAPVAGEAIDAQTALPRSIGSLDAVSDAMQQAIEATRPPVTNDQE
ncbi:MAG: hypothetical protein Alpg2KO_13370 [Alphaproteobacteria bacterium]